MQYKVVEIFIRVWIFLYNQNIPILKALLTQLKRAFVYIVGKFADLIHLRDCSRVLHIVVPIVRDGERGSTMVIYLQREGVVNLGVEYGVERDYPAIVGLHGLVVLQIFCASVQQYTAIGWRDTCNIRQAYIHCTAPDGKCVVDV